MIADFAQFRSVMSYVSEKNRAKVKNILNDVEIRILFKLSIRLELKPS